MLCRYTKARYRGKELYLAFTVSAMFRLNDLLQEGEDVTEVLSREDADGLERFCAAASILAGCGARAREAEGFPRPTVPSKEELLACLSPMEYIDLKGSMLKAVLLGYGREVTDPEEEVDLELENMRKK